MDRDSLKNDFDWIREEPLIDLCSRFRRYRDLISLRRTVKKIIKEKDIDVLNIQVLSAQYGWIFLLGGLDIPLISSFWGTEIWDERSNMQLKFQKKVLTNSKLITTVTDTMKNKVMSDFNIDGANIRLAKYGILSVEDLKLGEEMFQSFREEFNLKDDSIKIAISYSGHKRHRHDFVLEKIGKIDSGFLEDNNVEFLIPFTYGDEKWKEEVKEIVMGHTLSARIRLIT